MPGPDFSSLGSNKRNKPGSGRRKNQIVSSDSDSGDDSSEHAPVSKKARSSLSSTSSTPPLNQAAHRSANLEELKDARHSARQPTPEPSVSKALTKKEKKKLDDMVRVLSGGTRWGF